MLSTLHFFSRTNHGRRNAITILLVLALLSSMRASSVSAYGLSTITIGSATVVEGDSGSVEMVFPVSRAGDITQAVSVTYTTQDGTALAGVDYTARSGVVTIPSGQSGAEVRVPVLGNTQVQESRSFTVELTGVENSYGPPVTFANQQAFSVNYNPASVAVGDFNMDGKPDLAAANVNSNTLSVLRNITAPGADAPAFASQQVFGVGSNPVSVAVGDFNLDGKPDLAAANYSSNTLSVLLNTTVPGADAPAFAAQQAFGVGGNPYSVTVGDFNMDGKPDLATANYGSTNLSVLLNTTAPGASTLAFAAQQTFAVGSNPQSVAVGDFNIDGKLDLAAANYSSNTLSVLLNTTAPGVSTPTFAAQQTFGVGGNPYSVAVGDFNMDGKPDLAAANTGSDNLSVLLNTTAPGASTPAFATQQDFTTGVVPLSVAVGDLNGDGKPDLAAANFDEDTLSVLLNTTPTGASTPTFAAQQTFATGDHPRSAAVGDFNMDGKPDLAVANSNSNDLSVLLNTTPWPGTGAPAFATQQTFATGSTPRLVVVGDFNGDGKPDLAAANADSNTFSVLLNTTPPGASSPTFAAQQAFDAGSDPFSVAVGDFNGDGKPDLAAANADSNTLSVRLNTTAPGASTPVFAARQAFATGLAPVSVVAGDFNSDGKPDLAAANISSDTLSVLLNTTTPGASTSVFAAQQAFATGLAPVSVVAGDFNSDGKPDLAAANNTSNNLSVLLNTTTPGASTPNFAARQTFAVGSNPNFVAVGDFNTDGKPDLAAATVGSNTLSVLLNTTAPGAATPAFTAQQAFGAGSNPYSVAVGDFNTDGKPDLVAANYISGTLSVLLNTTTPGSGTPAFATQETIATGSDPFSVAVGDFNGDGKPDLAAGNYGANNLFVLLNQPWKFVNGVGTITDDDTPASIVKTAGDNQSALINFVFSTPFTVEVRNGAGYPVQGASVTFGAPSSGAGGSFATDPTVLTDSSGRATAPAFTANATPGEYQVTATIDGGPSTSFTLENWLSVFLPVIIR